VNYKQSKWLDWKNCNLIDLLGVYIHVKVNRCFFTNE
jgi:hypothetical protein